MPFAELATAAIGLAQLQTVVRARLGDRVEVNTYYLNHDLADRLGPKQYAKIHSCDVYDKTGLGDWLFRRLAFDEVPDTTDQMVSLMHVPDAQKAIVTRDLLALEATLGQWCTQVIGECRLDEADVVGFTSMASQNVACFALARRLKAFRPGVRIVMGGANCAPPMGGAIVRNVPAIDHVFAGQSLESFPAFLEAVRAGQTHPGQGIPGVSSRLGPAGPVEIVGTVGGELDINTNVPLDYSDFLESLARYPSLADVQPALIFATSRGCWWGQRSQCSFCGLNGADLRYRAMTPENAIEHITRLWRHVPPARKLVSADNVIPDEYFDRVIPHLNIPRSANVFFEVRPTLTDEQLALAAAQSGLGLLVGIEALSASTLKLMRKGTTAFQNIRFLRQAAAMNLLVGWQILIGSPGETPDVFRRYEATLPAL